jgi:hypothetical protein
MLRIRMHCIRRLIEGLLTANKVCNKQTRASVACWLFNPFTVTISTRGSGEALVTVQILLMLNCLLQGKRIHARCHPDLTRI